MAESRRWSAQDLPDLSGRTIIVTGANSGIGYEAALQFARVGARLVLACRSAEKASGALQAIRSAHAHADVQVMELDLASLASVCAFAKNFKDRFDALHVLCNNAGVMNIPRKETSDGFEMQLGTNHLGHFALTGLLLERLLAAPQARVVSVSSTMHRAGRMRFDDLQGERSYGNWSAYGQSKLANLLFSFELQRRFEAARASAISVACHPGYAATNLQFVGPRMEGSSFMERMAGLSNRLFSQSAAMGALPTLYAATSAEVKGGDYIGPDRFFENWGHPRKVGSTARARNLADAARLWEESERLTGVTFEALAP